MSSISKIQKVDISSVNSIGKLSKSAITKVEGIDIPSQASGWVQHFDNNDWQVESAAIWDGIKWVKNG